MRHLDLFSGIGGFALAARWSGFETVAFCEIDQYCQKVLAKHWPQVPIYSDVKKLTRQGLESDGISQPDIITGGFPCQPFSVAGKQRGQDDNRHLWPEMLRIISELHPAWVVGENVSGFVRLALDDCISDLEGQGYETETFVLPACAVNAPHRRDRVWIMANSKSFNHREQAGEINTKGAPRLSGEPLGAEPVRCRENVADSPRHVREGGGQESVFRVRDLSAQFGGSSENQRNRFNPTEPDLGRVADGIPNRVDRLKGLGNAVVPQLVHNLFEIIKQVDNNNGR